MPIWPRGRPALVPTCVRSRYMANTSAADCTLGRITSSQRPPAFATQRGLDEEPGGEAVDVAAPARDRGPPLGSDGLSQHLEPGPPAGTGRRAFGESLDERAKPWKHGRHETSRRSGESRNG